jgi:hypothetical protein
MPSCFRALRAWQREKREWQKERAQLLTVIELQQRELGKRANSVQERAAEIAREFAKSVLSFEERLVACKALHEHMDIHHGCIHDLLLSIGVSVRPCTRLLTPRVVALCLGQWKRACRRT